MFVAASLANEMAHFSKRADLRGCQGQGVAAGKCVRAGGDLRNISMFEEANSCTAVRREPTMLACFSLPLNWRCKRVRGGGREGRGGGGECCREEGPGTAQHRWRIQ